NRPLLILVYDRLAKIMKNKKPDIRFPSHVKLGLSPSIASDVQLGIISGRTKGAPKLLIGSSAVVRSGCVIYAGTKIGDHLETGHHVVIREENQIGDHFNIWNSSTIDYGCKIGDR